ncbi:MAPEG family protein [Massilia sp. W12]|uniref:MAPEG family protein n=1 Tax=Massilia sp. W12 TaxID=3126507 RepID=UPI0030CDD9F0
MPFACWAILIAGLLPVCTVALAKAQRCYDNHDPRTWLERQQGWRRRADFAQRNHFEAFPFFAAAVLVALMYKLDGARIDQLAAVFLAARIAYTVCYLFDWALLRSLFWFVGYGCIIALFVMTGGAA